MTESWAIKLPEKHKVGVVQNKGMQIHTLPLMSAAPGQSTSLQVLRFGAPDASPKAYVQAALHADEIPALLVAQALKRTLLKLEAKGQLIGQVVLVPYANPIGLAQMVQAQHHGRFDLRDGVNFNRGFADLTDIAATALAGQLGSDAVENRRLVRAALCNAASGLVASTPVQDLKNKLLRMAMESDIVLDLHCDAEAVMHVYGHTDQTPQAVLLGAFLGARAVLMADDSGDSPFDECCSRPWAALQRRFAPHPLGASCFSSTVELRGEADVSHALAEQDAAALIGFLATQGLLSATKDSVGIAPTPLCVATPLACSEPLDAPHAGVVVFRKSVGDVVAPGDAIVDLIDIDSGAVTTMTCASGGVLYARCSSRWATPGKRLAKIAGHTVMRTGKLLGA